ncbi:hypothetical protein D3C80_982730 [compost metagenome]
MSIDSISLGLIIDNGLTALLPLPPDEENPSLPAKGRPLVDFPVASPETGTPSITYKGSFVPEIEVVPRTLTEAALPGAPELFVTVTPETFP